MRCDVCVAPENCAKIGRCLAIDETEAVARIEEEIRRRMQLYEADARDNRLNGYPPHVHVAVDDLRALLARLERVERERDQLRERLAAASGWAEDEELAALREDKARLDWMERDGARIGRYLSGPAENSPKWVIWGDTDEDDKKGESVREVIDAARGEAPNGE